jgi:hypothetical protein
VPLNAEAPAIQAVKAPRVSNMVAAVLGLTS